MFYILLCCWEIVLQNLRRPKSEKVNAFALLKCYNIYIQCLRSGTAVQMPRGRLFPCQFTVSCLHMQEACNRGIKITDLAAHVSYVVCVVLSSRRADRSVCVWLYMHVQLSECIQGFPPQAAAPNRDVSSPTSPCLNNTSKINITLAMN